MNLLVTGAWASAKENIHLLKLMGHSVCFLQQETAELPCTYDWVEGVICNGLFLTHPIERFINLRYIQLTSAGYDRVPITQIQKRNIIIHNAKGVYSIPMAEFAIAGVLQLYKRSLLFAEQQQNACWEKCRGVQELFKKTVCIVGCGSVGTECAKRFDAFGCKVIGIDMFPRLDKSYFKINGIEMLDEALLEADIVVLTLPLTEQTYHLLNSERLRRMKSGAILVNIARGAVLDTAALLKAVSRLGGAVLDVFEEEPLPPSSPLWRKKNVILTPHNSFVGDGNGARLSAAIFKNLKQIEA